MTAQNFDSGSFAATVATRLQHTNAGVTSGSEPHVCPKEAS